MPNYQGVELAPADDLGINTFPDCCGSEMAAGKPDSDRYRDYTCGACGTVLTVAPTGLIFDITSA